MNPVLQWVIVTPAKAGVQGATAAALPALDSRFRGNDEGSGNYLRLLDSFWSGSELGMPGGYPVPR
jgi:hypothetical protein